MSGTREVKQLQKAKSKAQRNNNLREEASLCNQLGEILARSGNFQAAIEEHQQELQLSESLRDVIGCAIANRKIGECFAELGNYEAALKHQRRHLQLARSVNDAAEEQRAWATIGRTFLFRYEADQSQDSLREAEGAFRKSLTIVDERLEGKVLSRELSEMRARLYLNLGFVYDGLKDSQRCSDFIRRSVFIAEQNKLLEDLYRANFNLGSIHFRNGQHSRAVRCLEHAKECARKMKEKFLESECYHSIGQVLLNLGDFVAAKRALKKAYTMGSQQPSERGAVRRNLKYAIKGCHLEEALAEQPESDAQGIVGMTEQLGDLYCKVGCYRKALDSYQAQLSGAQSLGKPARELSAIHVSLAATYTDLKQHKKAVEHYRKELALREGSPVEECETWLNIALSLEEDGRVLEELEECYQSALECAQRAGLPKLQHRVLKQLLTVQQKLGSPDTDSTVSRLQDLCGSQAWSDGESEGEEEQEEEENSEELMDSDLELSESEEEDLDGYQKAVPGRRKAKQWSRRNEKGETILHRACIEGNLKQVQYVVDKGHPLNPRDYCGWTPLHEACNHGHLDIVRFLLDRGANVNDTGGPHCDGVTPLHDALTCGNFQVAQLLIERGASGTLRNAKGETPHDSLREWLRMYGKHLDQETRQECRETENLLKTAASGRAPRPPQQMVSDFQDSQLFDAENSEPLVPPSSRVASSSLGVEAVPCSSSRGRSSSTQQPQYRDRDGDRDSESVALELREQAEDQLGSCSSSESTTELDDSIISPLRPIRGKRRLLRPTSPLTLQPVNPTYPHAADDLDWANEDEDEAEEDPPIRSVDLQESPVSMRKEYQRAIQSLGSAKSRLLMSNSLSEPGSTLVTMMSASSRSALVPEEEYVADDWLEDDIGEVQSKKRRRISSGQEARREAVIPAKSTRGQSASVAIPTPTSRGTASRGMSMKKGPSRQVKMTQLSGMVVLGSRRSGSPLPFTQEEQSSSLSQTPVQHHLQAVAPALPAPIRVRVRVQDNVFLIPIPRSEAETCTVSWLADQAAQRYYQACGLHPHLSLQKEGALLAPQDMILHVLHSNEEVLAEVRSWDLPSLLDRYRKACQSLSVDENRTLSRLCELQDGSPCLSASHLSLQPRCIAPLLRCLKLQACLKELRLPGNRLHDSLMGELIATATTMPSLRILDLSANHITGEGLKQACVALEGQSQTVFPSLEELDLSLNLLGDSISQSLASLVLACPLLATLRLQGCGLSACFLQHHRPLLASALTGTGLLKTVCLSHNALGSMGVELVLRTMPPNSLTRLELSAIRLGPADYPIMDHVIAYLTQEGCCLTHLSLAGNGLTDSDICTLARCLPVCPSLVSLDLSGNPGVTAAGLQTLLSVLKEGHCTLQSLNLAGCLVSGPWDSVSLDSLSSCLQELRLCSRRLNKLDKEALVWDRRPGLISVMSRHNKCFIRTADS